MDACTIISTNFLAHARTLYQSYRRHNPDGRFFVLIIDEVASTDVSREDFTVLRPQELSIEDFPALTMLYDAYELSMALRPYFLLHLQQTYESQKLVFLDADLLVTGRLTEVEELLDTHSVILTPSFITPIPEDGRFPDDRCFLACGIFNGGFFACSVCDETTKVLQWLSERLRHYAYNRPEEFMFGDQKWLDFMPAIAPKLHILRNPGYNLSYWNLHERTLTEKNGVLFANEEPLVFYHFSGFTPSKHHLTISKHQNRLSLEDLPLLKKFTKRYSEELHRNGFDDISKIPYSYGRFSSGVRVSPIIRRIYENINGCTKFSDPWSEQSNSYHAWLHASATSLGKVTPLKNIHREIWALSVEAQARCPKPMTEDLAGFCQWLRENRKELELDAAFTKNLPTSMTNVPATRTSRWKTMMRQRHTFEPYQVLCRLVKSVLGKKLYDSLKPRRDPLMFTRLRLRNRAYAHTATSGLNIVFSETGRTGIAECMRGIARALQDNGTHVQKVDSRATPGRQERREDLSQDFPHDITLVGGGMEEIAVTLDSLRIPETATNALIGYAPWELTTLPATTGEFLQSHFDELWAMSTFSAQALSQSVTIPVIVMPPPIDVSMVSSKTRADFGIPSHVRTFLTIFDFFSRVERKNPEGLITSFIQAFAHREDVILIISAKNGTDFPEEFSGLQSMISKQKNIRLMTDYLTRPDILALMRCSDFYASLHRSEGFGLTIAEAMALGVPVIATDYGGSTDFVTAATGFPVPYRETILERDAGPYGAGQTWAEPDTVEASTIMLTVMDHPEEVSKRAVRGQALVSTVFEHTKIVERIEERLSLLRGNRA